MAEKQTPPKRSENLISIVIICILILIGIGILIKQYYYDISDYGIVIDKQSTEQSQNIDFEKIDFAPHIPAGYKLMLSSETYGIKNLYEKINGKAPLYTESGFKKLVCQRIGSKEKKSLWFEIYIYDMTNQLNAFSVYSRQRRTDAKKLNGIDIAYQTANAVFFITGPYYVEMIGSDTSGALLYPMVNTAQNISAKLLQRPTINLPELSLIKKSAMLPGSTKLYLSNAFGFNGLNNTFTGKIKFKNRSVTVFFSKHADSAKAKTTAAKYADFLEDNDGTIESKKGGTYIIKIFGSYETVFSIGSYTAGVHEAETRKETDAGKKFLMGLLDKSPARSQQ